MNVSNAIKAIEGIKSKPEYANLRIAHGKDRCANAPRSGPQGGAGARRGVSGNGPNTGEPISAIDDNNDGDDEVVDFLNGDHDHVEVMHVDAPHQTNGIPA
jgi:hypothetical protein